MRKRILYLEDELNLASMVKDTLEISGYEVLHLENGLDIIEQSTIFSPHLFILDIMLPFKDGFTIGEELRIVFPKIPIIFLTAKDQVEDVVKGFKAGGNDYMRKPFSLKELIVRIENLLPKPNSSIVSANAKQIGSFEFNYMQLTLSGKNGVQQLSFKEGEIINLLSNAINQPIKRKTILLKVWGDDSYYNSRNLDVYMRKIRTYFSSDKSISLTTLRGFGYKLGVLCKS